MFEIDARFLKKKSILRLSVCALKENVFYMYKSIGFYTKTTFYYWLHECYFLCFRINVHVNLICFSNCLSHAGH